MFNNVYLNYNKNKKIYTFSGNFGDRLVNRLHKVYLGKSRTNQLFIKINSNEIVIYRFFILELHQLLKAIVAESSIQDVNLTSLNNVIKLIEDEIYTATHVELNRDHIDNLMRYSILEHQESIFTRYQELASKFNYRGILIDAAIGSGKSYSALALAEAIDSQKIIVICPLPTLERVWVKSIAGEQSDSEMVYKQPQRYYSSRDSEYNDEKYILIHYEAMSKLSKIIPKLGKHNVTVIIDEVHNLTSKKSKRTNQLLNIIKELDPDHVIPMSGTPIKAIVTELSIILQLVDRDFTSIIENRFLKLYKSPNWLLKEILPTRFSEHSVKVTKESIKLQPVHTEYIPVEFKGSSKYKLSNIAVDVKDYVTRRRTELLSKYDEYVSGYNRTYNLAKQLLIDTGIKLSELTAYEKDFKSVQYYYKRNQLMMVTDLMSRVNIFENTVIAPVLSSSDRVIFKEAKTILKYLNLKIRGEALANVVMRARIDAHKDIAKLGIKYRGIIESSTKKCLVFSNYIDVCDIANKAITKIGYKTLQVYGVHSKNLNRNVTTFIKDRKYNPLITTYKSLSTGVPLIEANVVIAIDLPFRDYTYQQAIGRVWRTGQDKKVYVYIPELLTDGEPNINTRNIDIMLYFAKEVENITGNKMPMSVNRSELSTTLSTEEINYINDSLIREQVLIQPNTTNDSSFMDW